MADPTFCQLCPVLPSKIVCSHEIIRHQKAMCIYLNLCISTAFLEQKRKKYWTRNKSAVWGGRSGCVALAAAGPCATPAGISSHRLQPASCPAPSSEHSLLSSYQWGATTKQKGEQLVAFLLLQNAIFLPYRRPEPEELLTDLLIQEAMRSPDCPTIHTFSTTGHKQLF